MSLFNLAFARQTGGQFILRVEDTDQARYVAGSEQQIYDALAWLGLDWDEGPDIGGPCAPYRQSERLATYQPYVDQLIAAGHAYYCWCSPRRLAELRQAQAESKQAVTGYDRLCYGLTRQQRSELPGFSPTPVVRMAVPDDVELTFTDLIRGQVAAPRPDDQVILKADGFPTYHLAVVVDDHLMGITHVVRGEEWISSTPKHILLYRWLGWDAPAWCHMPLLRNADHSKISKRKNPAARLLWFRQEGFLPEALRNFLQLMGYPPLDDDAEISSFEDFVGGFDWAKVNTVGPVFDLAKLDWLNGAYIRSLDPVDLADRVVDHIASYQSADVPGGQGLTPAFRTRVAQAIPLIAPRLTRLGQALDKLRFLLVADADLAVDPAAAAAVAPNATVVLPAAIDLVESSEDFSAEAIHRGLEARLVDDLGLTKKAAFAAIRVAITGASVSPPLFESMAILGPRSCVARLRALAAQLA